MSYRYVSPLLLAAALLAPAALGQPTGAELFATGLFGSVGITAGSDGTLWASLPGTGNDDDAAVVVLTSDGVVHPFAEGLPSGIAGVPVGANHLLFDGTDLWVAVGTGNNDERGYLYRFATSTFTPGDLAIGPSDAEEVVDIGEFAFFEDFAATNVYGLALGPDGTLYMTDAAANAVFQRAPDGTLSVLATLDPIEGVEAVPTGIVFKDGALYVAAFTGFPWGAGRSRVYAIDLTGTVSVFRDGLTHTVDLALDPRDGALTALRFGLPNGAVHQPRTGRALRLTDDLILADEFDFSSAMTYDATGDLYVVQSVLFGGIGDGNVYRVSSSPATVAAEPGSAPPESAALRPPFPNPTSAGASLTYQLDEAAHVTLAVYDLLGREVARLVDSSRPAGEHTAAWDGRDGSGRRPGPGVYVVRLRAGEVTESRKVLLLR